MLKETIVEFMKSVDLQPLQYLAAVRVAISTCESEDVQYMIGRFRKTDGNDGTGGFSEDQWKQLRGKVKRKLNQIRVPDRIIDIVSENLWPVSFEIFKWILYHMENTGLDCSSNFCWTPQVSIDYEKTAEILIQNERLDIKKRFKLACIYCLELEVRSLWEQLSLSEQRDFFIRGNSKKSNQNPIVLYWSCYVQEMPIGYWDNNALNHGQVFKYSLENGYLSAAKYFLSKLKLQFRETVIFSCFINYLRKPYKSDCKVNHRLAIACFLVRQLPSDHQGFPWLTTLCFRYFLEWPMQKHFMTVINRLRSYLREKTYKELLKRIFGKYIRGFKDHDYKELFMEFWLQMPEDCKIYLNSRSFVGVKIFMTFVKKHIGFVYDEKSFTLKAKFRDIVFQREIPENATEKEIVEFFKFLVRERVTTKTFINRFSHEFVISFSNVLLEELLNLIDGILETA